MLKTCTKCRKRKSVSNFYRHPQASDGLRPDCKECNRKSSRRYRLKNKEDINARDRIRLREYYDKNKDTLKERNKRWRIANPEKLKEIQARYRRKNKLKISAHRKVNYAVLKGKIKRKSCEVCGAQESDAHHHDYNQPLAVTWLCRKHHAELHR